MALGVCLWVAPVVAQPVALGTLRTDDGQLAGFVGVRLEVTDMRVRRQVATLETTSAADGTFRFDLAEFADAPRLGLQFNTRSPRFREAMQIVMVTPAEFPVMIELELQPGAVLAGRVVDDEGAPLERTAIMVPGLSETYTDSEGRYTLYGLAPEGIAEVRAEREGFVAGIRNIEIPGVELIEHVDFTLVPAADLRGQVVTPLGEAVTEGTVVVTLDNEALRRPVMPDGSFHFRAAPTRLAGATVALHSPRYLFTPRPFTTAEDDTRQIRLVVEWPVVLEGVVRDAAGQPVSGAEVLVGDNVGQAVTRFATDGEGRFEAFPFEPGASFLLTLLPPSPEGRRAMGELEFHREKAPGAWVADVNPWPAGYVSRIDATLTGTTLRMVRTDTGVGGLPGTVMYEGTVSPDFARMEGTMRAEALGANGQFQARAYQPSGSMRGVWDLRESLSDGEHRHAPVQRTVVAAPLTGTQYMDFVLPPPGRLTGRVIDGLGRPAIEGRVEVVRWNNTPLLRRTATIESGGRFDLAGLPDGVLEIVALAPDGTALSPPALVRAGVTDYVLGPTDDPMDSIHAGR